MKKTSNRKASVRKKQHSKKSMPPPKSARSGNSTKQAKFISLLKQSSGVTVAELIKATGWQAHSIRGFISGTLKKRLSLKVISDTTSDGLRRYRISEGA
jgi:hypothetical protein